MDEKNTAHKNNLNELMQELQKNTPDQEKIKFLFKEFDFSYSNDPIEQMMTVLSHCDSAKNKSMKDLG